MYVDLPRDVVRRCWVFGYENARIFGEKYKTGYGNQAVKIADEGKTNFVGRVGEYAACQALRLNPDEALVWENGRPDGGVDFKLKKWSVDVKSSDHPRASRLIWPVSKNGEICKLADVLILALVKLQENGDAVVDLAGYATRKLFCEKCRAAKELPGISDGTLYMDKRDLLPVEDIVNWLLVQP